MTSNDPKYSVGTNQISLVNQEQTYKRSNSMVTKQNSHNETRRLWTLFTSIAIIAMLLSGCGASQNSKTYKVGVLAGLNAFAPTFDGFKAKMTELGYVEGQNISYDVQETNVDIEAYKSITKKFVDDEVDLIFVFPTEAAMEAKAATQGTDIPVVFAMSFTDVSGVNLIDSIREPGANITGVRFPSADIASKRLEILLEMVPNAKRIFVPYLQGYPNVPSQLEVIRPQAASQGIELIEFGATGPQDLQAELDGFVTADGLGIDAILMIAEPLAITPVFYAVLGEFSYTHQVPIGGALMSIEGKYASIFGLLPDAKTAGEQGALLADKVFGGTNAGTIPVITAESYFQINYTAAQDFGLTVPEGLLKQADEIIR
jgi:putative tryptophan/tyrosine transport system substrate-binding protein